VNAGGELAAAAFALHVKALGAAESNINAVWWVYRRAGADEPRDHSAAVKDAHGHAAAGYQELGSVVHVRGEQFVQVSLHGLAKHGIDRSSADPHGTSSDPPLDKVLPLDDGAG